MLVVELQTSDHSTKVEKIFYINVALVVAPSGNGTVISTISPPRRCPGMWTAPGGAGSGSPASLVESSGGSPMRRAQPRCRSRCGAGWTMLCLSSFPCWTGTRSLGTLPSSSSRRPG
ncbi:hypothetical protein [Micromonospora echinofusca]|uniref:hypothetical protein n=1 Tax=Micromonospora echinofusca TaxID=47858 RepID=UPI0034D63C59